jgi:hypothetical protein
MNDFTIEELALLACWSVNRFAQVGMDQSYEEGTIALTHKVQGMIINYCDHEWIEYPNDCAAMPYCKKCRMAG